MLKLADAMRVGAVVLVLAAVALIWQQSQPSPTGRVVADKELVRFAYVPAPYNAIPIVALRKGFFAQEGLQIEEARTSFIGYVFQGLADGKIDFLTGAETPAVFVALKGGQFKILAKHEENRNDLGLVSRAEARITSIKDLAGKRVGLPFTSVAHYNLWRLLQENNISISSVRLVDLSPQNMLSALSHGDVDAIFIWEPVPSQIVAALGQRVSSLNPPSEWMMNIYVSEDFSQRKNLEKKALRALLRAQKFIEENRSEAISIVAKESNIDGQTLSALWPHWTFKLAEFNEPEVMAGQAEWAMESGLVAATAIPDFAAMTDKQMVEEVRTETK